MKNYIPENIKDIYRYLKCPKIENPKIPASPKSIIFVCKGNICRSPFAEHIAKKIATERSLEKISFSSAGLGVTIPLASPDDALIIAENFGVKLHDHKSQFISNNIAASNDMIIAMETWHVIHLREMFPDLREYIYLLSFFEKNNRTRLWSYHRNNISDPYGKSMSEYHECFQRINRCVKELLSKVANE